MSRYALLVVMIVAGASDIEVQACDRCRQRTCCCSFAGGTASSTPARTPNSAVRKDDGDTPVPSARGAGRTTDGGRTTDSDSGKGPTNRPSPATDTAAIEARLNRIEDLLGLPHKVERPESAALGGALVAGLVDEAIRELAPSLIEELRAVTRRRFGLKPEPAAPAPAAPAHAATPPAAAPDLAKVESEVKDIKASLDRLTEALKAKKVID